MRLGHHVMARPAAAALGWVALAAATVVALRAGQPDQARWRLLALIGVLWALFALAAWLLVQVPVRTAVPLLVAGGIALQALALAVAPQMTDDFYRYAWDGRVQAAGIDPYRYPPTAPEVAAFRDGWLFPGGEPRLNHPDERTVYPPLAQAYFAGVHHAAPPGARHKPWQGAAALLAVATTLALVTVLRVHGRDPRLAVLWAWCPTVFLEAGNNAHVDVLGALLVVLGLGALARHRPALGGGLLGAAVAVKLLPALVLPAALRRRPFVVAGTATAVVLLTYLPHIFAVGPRVLGYLPGYLSEEGYDGDGRFALLRLLLPPPTAPYAAAVLLAGAALLAWHRADPHRPWKGALVMTGVTFLVAGPSYPWYALLLIALAALDGAWPWLAVAAAGYPAYFAGALDVRHESMQRWAYGLALVGVTAGLACRRIGTDRSAREPVPA